MMATNTNVNDLRIVFMGTPDFAVGVLKKLLDEKRNIVGVITAPDRPAGRGRKLRPSAVKEYALSHNLKVLQPTNLKNENFIEELQSLNANLQIIVAFRMLPKVVWDMPKLGTFNLHASLLPQYRGAAPINWAIMNGETKTGVTTFFIDEKIDTGAIIANSGIDIATNETVGTLHDKLMLLGSELVEETVKLIETGNAIPKKQQEDVNLKEAPKLTHENMRVNWDRPAKEIDQHIRGLNPYPTAWTILYNNGEEIKMKLYEVQERRDEHQYKTGLLFANKKRLKVAVPDGYIYIKVLQLPGKRKMPISDLLNGYKFEEGAKVM